MALSPRSKSKSRQAEDELEKLSVEAFTHAAHGIAIGDPATNCIRTCNPAYARLLGRNVVELVGLPISELYAPVDRARLRAFISEADRSGQASFQIEMLRKDATLVPVGVVLVTVKDRTGAVAYRVATVNDLTAQRQEERKSRLSEEQFQQLFNHSLDAVMLTVPDGPILEANPAACVMFDRTAEEIRQKGRSGTVDLTDPRLPALVAERQRTGFVRGELRFFRKDGSTFEGGIASAIFTDGNGQLRASMIVRDLSAQKQAEHLITLQRDLAMKLSSTASVDEGLALCLDAAIGIAGLDSGGFYLKDEKSGALNLAVYRGVSAEFASSMQRFGPDTPQARLVENGAVGYTELDLLSYDRPESARREGLKFLAIVPFRTEQRAIGCLSLSAHRVHRIGELERRALEAIAANAALAILRMQTERTLRDERSRLTNIIAGTRVATWEWNAQTNETVINETWAELVGYTLAELQPTTRETWERLVNSEDSRNAWDLLQRHLTGATPYFESECRMRHKAGHWIWVLIRGRLLNRTATGEPHTVFGTHVEITAMKLAAAKLSESEQNYREIFNATNDAIFVHDAATGQVLDVNDGMLRMFGFDSKEEYLTSPPDVTFVDDPDFSPDEASRRMQVAIRGTPQVFDWKTRKKDGTVLSVEVALRSAQIGDRPRVLAVVRDVTQRKRAEEAYREIEARFAAAFRFSPSLMSISRLSDGTYLDVNEAFVAVSGFSRDEIIGRTSVEIGWVSAESRTQMAEVVKTTGRMRNLELTLTGKGGRRVEVLFAGELITISGETMLLSNGVDITDRKRTEAALRESEEKFLKAFRRSPNLKSISRLEDGTYLDVNDRFLEVFGFRRDEIIDRRSVEVGLINEADRVRLITDLRVRGSVDKLEARLTTRTGREVDVQFGCELLTIGGEPCVLWNAADVTVQKGAEAALKNNAEQYQLLFDSNPNPMYVYDQESLQFFAVNDAAVRQYGWSREEFLKLTILDLRPPADREAARVAIAATLDPKFKPVGIWRQWRKDGTTLKAETVAHSVVFNGRHGRLCSAIDVTERERLQIEARETQERYRGLIESAFDGSIIHQDGVIVEANHAYARMFGYTVGELIGKPVLEMSAPEFVEVAKEKIATQSEEIYETVGLRKDGSRLQIETAGKQCTFRGRSARMAAVRDITARKDAENALRTSEDRYRSLVETSFDWVWEVDTAGRYTYASSQVTEMLGFSPDEVIGRTPFDLMPDDEAGRVGVIFKQLIQDRAPIVALENTNRHRDGRLVVVETNGIPLFSPDGVWIGYRGMDRDITARREAERTLRLHGAALEVAANAVMISDRDGHIEWVNPAFSASSGWSFEEAIGKIPGELLNSDQHDPAFYRQMEETLKAGEIWRGEIIVRRKDGALRTEDMTVTPLRDRTGQITHYISIKQDISDRKALEAQNRQAQRMEAIGTLASGIAHDLNNILAPMLMVSGLLKAKLPDESDQEILAMLHQGAQRGANIVKQLLTFSRGQAGDRVPVQSRHFLKEMMGIMRETFPREIDLHTDAPANLPLVKADPTQLHQVILNLCVNARDAMPDGGRLHLGAGTMTLREGDPRLPPDKSPGDFVAIEVRDSGHGIPPEIKDRIFDPFFTTKPLGKGTGLGLSTVIGIVRRHDGFVTVDSTPGSGTSFKVFLPAVTDAQVSAPPAADVTPAAGGGQLILVVDDERNVREAVRLVLESRGFRVVLAVNGKDGLSQYLVNRREIAAVLTDMMMPVMNGVALARMVRALDPTRPIIVMSGMSEVTQREELAALGIAEIVPKPCSDVALIEAIQRKLCAAP